MHYNMIQKRNEERQVLLSKLLTLSMIRYLSKKQANMLVFSNILYEVIL